MLNRCTSDELEELRIREVYRQRATTDADARYSYFCPAALLGNQELERVLLSSLRALRYASLEDRRILDVGCGNGGWLRRFIIWGARPEYLFGIDLQEHLIEAARRLLPADVHVQSGNAAALAYPDESFDLVFQFTMFTSILDLEMKRQIARQMVRVLRRGGHIVWYDFFFNNPFNLNVRGIGKSEVRSLFPDCQARFTRLTLAPPIARVLARISPAFCELASCSRMLCTHYLAFLQKT